MYKVPSMFPKLGLFDRWHHLIRRKFIHYGVISGILYSLLLALPSDSQSFSLWSLIGIAFLGFCGAFFGFMSGFIAGFIVALTTYWLTKYWYNQTLVWFVLPCWSLIVTNTLTILFTYGIKDFLLGNPESSHRTYPLFLWLSPVFASLSALVIAFETIAWLNSLIDAYQLKISLEQKEQ